MPNSLDAPEPWYVTAFRSDYRQLYSHRDDKAAQQEVAFLLASGLQGPVLDLCCGFGRHAKALQSKGLFVVGVDLSADLLVAADAQLDGHLARCDARQLPFRDASFGGLTNLFSSFGYFGVEGDQLVLDEISRVLRPGGAAFMDLMNPAWIRATLVPESRREQAGAILHERRSLVDGGQRVVKEVRITLAEGEERMWTEDVRLYDVHDLEGPLAARGLELVAVTGNFDSTPLSEQSPRQVLSLRRR